MCGVVGQVAFKSQIDEKTLIELRDMINHRGPDDKGIYKSRDKICFLGHRRLSIIDLSKNAQQPMTSKDGRFSIIFNGEIYNYLDLKNKLTKSGVKFKSSSDTEVLLELYMKYGVKCLDRLRGMFVFAVWDELKQELFLARDPLGIKSVFYIKTKDGIIFCSELRPLRKLNLCGNLNFKNINTFLKKGSIPSPDTIFEGVKSLEPGNFLVVSKNQKIEKLNYWELSSLELDELQANNRNEIVAFTKESLLESMKSHLVSDVPVGAFLSGGIDSSAIVSLMRQSGQNKIGTFSLAFENQLLDESLYSKHVSELFDTDHHELVVTNDKISNYIDNFIKSMDQPTIDGLNTYIVSKLAKNNGYKVVTSGIGGDELFRGYNLFKILPKIDSIFKYSPSSFNKILSYLIQRLISQNRINSKWGRFCSAISPNYSFVKLYEQSRALFSNQEIRNILNLDCENFEQNDDQRLIEIFNTQNSLESKISMMETYRYLGSQLLYDSDIFSMANSIELRTPFIDKTLYEKIYSIKNDVWFNDKKYNKSLLVDAVGDLPHEIYNRPKMGFVLPKNLFLKKEIYEIKSEILNKDYYNSLEKNFVDGKIHYSKIWSIRILDEYISSVQN